MANSLVDLAFDRCLPHWGGEFVIALRYFDADSRVRSRDRDQRWLEFQIWKEWFGSGVYGPAGVTVADLLREAVERVRMPGRHDDAAQLEDACSLLEFGRDEFAHFTALFDLWRRSFPDGQAAVESWGVLPAGEELMTLRHSLRDDPLGAIAVRLSEGGGLGLFFGIEHVLRAESGPFEHGLLQAVARILADERGHLVGNFVAATRTLGTDDDAIERVVALLAEICAVKLREREQQFGVQLAGPNTSEFEIYRERYLKPLRTNIIEAST
jgi:hypothetical protein